MVILYICKPVHAKPTMRGMVECQTLDRLVTISRLIWSTVMCPWVVPRFTEDSNCQKYSWNTGRIIIIGIYINVQMVEHQPHQWAPFQVAACMADLTHPYHKDQPCWDSGINLVEIPLTTVSLCKCLPSHLGPPWPMLSFYLHGAKGLNCSTGSFNVSKPMNKFFCLDCDINPVKSDCSLYA